MNKTIKRKRKTPMTTQTIYYASTPSPLGPLWAAVSERGLWALEYGVDQNAFLLTLSRRGPGAPVYHPAGPTPALQQVAEYLQGQRREFDLAIDWTGMTDWQKQVRQAVAAIPYGQTRSYGEIASQVCTIRAARAVGRANATNPIPFVIPCHRVIGSNGALTGYGGQGGVQTKAWLLALEQAH